MSNFFYNDGTEEIKEELLDGKAKEWAESFLKPKWPPRGSGMKNPKLTSAQLRKFHREVKELEERVKGLENPQTEFTRIRPIVKMLKSKVAYACPSNGVERKVPEEFRKYIEDMVDNVVDAKDFLAFALCFEAVVGYFYGQGGR